MKILVTGSSGFIGGHVVREILHGGHQVVALSRSSPSVESERQPEIEQLNCDLSVDGSLTLEGLGIDVVVHLAASLSGSAEDQYRSTVHGTQNLLDEMRRVGIRGLIGVSSIAVLDYVDASPMWVIDEATPLFGNERDMGTYASIKARQEVLFAAFAAEPGHRCVILRPGLVFDENHLVNAHAGIVKGPLCVLVKHHGEVPVVSVAGVARAICSATERSIVSGEVIQLVDDDLPNQQAYLAGLRRRGLLPTGGIALPWRVMAGLITFLRGTARVVGLGGKLPEAMLPQSFAARMKPFCYSNAKARRLLGWVPAKVFS